MTVELANIVNVPVPGSPRFEQDTAMAITRLRAALGPTGIPTFSSAAFTGLTADKPVYANTDKQLQSVTVGTSLTFASPPTLDTIQDIRITASPIWEGLTLIGADAATILHCDINEFYVTKTVVVELVTGNPIGLLLTLTYNLE